jgi:hypothetical protein
VRRKTTHTVDDVLALILEVNEFTNSLLDPTLLVFIGLATCGIASIEEFIRTLIESELEETILERNVPCSRDQRFDRGDAERVGHEVARQEDDKISDECDE